MHCAQAGSELRCSSATRPLFAASDLGSPAQARGGAPRQAELVVDRLQQVAHHPVAREHVRRDRGVHGRDAAGRRREAVRGDRLPVHLLERELREARRPGAAAPALRAREAPEPLLEPPRAEALEDLRGQRQHLRAGEPDGRELGAGLGCGRVRACVRGLGRRLRSRGLSALEGAQRGGRGLPGQAELLVDLAHQHAHHGVPQEGRDGIQHRLHAGRGPREAVPGQDPPLHGERQLRPARHVAVGARAPRQGPQLRLEAGGAEAREELGAERQGLLPGQSAIATADAADRVARVTLAGRPVHRTDRRCEVGHVASAELRLRPAASKILHPILSE
mmetsp:Transcript_24596/g.69120  ORF Transcript_24596/g.69120 Transcript_24596/m.69120 type:complete len:334 (-) Transcript_24596:138-1139(-)